MTRSQVAFGPKVEVGSRLPELRVAAITRKTLALFAGASHDHTPIHIDLDHARMMGHEDVIAHGMLVMAYMTRLLTQWRPQRDLLRLKARFLDVVRIGDALSFTGHVVGIAEKDGVLHAEAAIRGVTQHGRSVIAGEAEIRLSASENRGGGR